MKTAVKSPEPSDYRCGLGIFITETPLTAAPKHFFRPLFPRTPHFPALRSDPMALSGASRRKQIPSRNAMVAVDWPFSSNASCASPSAQRSEGYPLAKNHLDSTLSEGLALARLAKKSASSHAPNSGHR
jgi:hypothetical protein